MISTENQSVSYTAFNKVFNISEKVGADNYVQDFVYGPDQQRWKTTLKKNNNVVKTIIFAGDYEKITDNGVTQELYYIGDKAIYVKKAGQEEKTYYTVKDHLGSILKLVDNNGTTVFEASYDPWGKQTITTNTFKFHRGFTGHEHLPEFNLINMNGRMYDPILGRFLSPDPFVQIPDFTQSFNRYAYCLNNPLIYTDPDGEWNWLVAGIGFIYGYVSYGLTNGDWGWKALGNGALSSVMWGIGYTGEVAKAGITPLSYAAQSAVSSTVNQFMPSMSIPIGNSNFSIGASFGLGISPNGLVGGVNFSGTYRNGDFALTGGIGASGNMSSVGGDISYGDVGVSYYETTYGGATGPDGKPNNQKLGGYGINIGEFSLRVENDLNFKIKGVELGGDGGDRWRTSAVEIGIKNFVLGTSVYTNEPDGSLDKNGYSKFWNRTKQAYADGTAYNSPLYVGVKQGGRVTRIGLNQPWIQDMTQNGVHLFLSKSSPLFPTPYGEYSSAYRYSGYYNPYSLYYR
ncbi:MAG: polymorphic toxin type 23 domain-containing protein [Candidatus Azobacteroides sp.]|nr:polymorphic toxin type 23 domain-containing protein [Candidatus Azobacteroides sp.]